MTPEETTSAVDATAASASTAAPEISDKVETKANEDKPSAEATTEEGKQPDPAATTEAEQDKAASDAAKTLNERKQRAKERVQEAVARQREAERRADRLERELAKLRTNIKAPVADEYTDPNKLNADQIGYTLDQREAQRLEREQSDAAEEANRQRQSVFRERVDEFRSTVDDFDSIVDVLNPILSGPSVEMIADLEEGPAVAYHLGKNPAEARRIEKLGPREKAFELGRLAARLTTTPPKRITAAPQPVNAVTGKSAGSSDDYADMGMAEYARRRMQEIKGKSR